MTSTLDPFFPYTLIFTKSRVGLGVCLPFDLLFLAPSFPPSFHPQGYIMRITGNTVYNFLVDTFTTFDTETMHGKDTVELLMYYR